MSIVMVYFLFWMMVIHKQECSVIRMDHGTHNTFEYVIQKYMNPLRRLSADLPNHAIEMEIEIHGSVPKETPYPQRRVIHLLNPYQPKASRKKSETILRSPQDAGEAEVSPPTSDATTPSTAAPATEAAQTTTTPPSPPPSPPPPPSPGASLSAPFAREGPETNDPSKIPVFMEDLQKALNELEKKLINSATPANGGVPSSSVRSIDDIVQMLKKGVHVEHRMPKAGDEKLEWVQIKIPKNMRM